MSPSVGSISAGAPKAPPDQVFPDPAHNHGVCLDTALDRAEAAFQKRGLKLTEQRRRVFAEIASSHHAVGAYDVLDKLAQTGGRLAPVSVYRALDALLAAGCIHRLESRNAFFACHTMACRSMGGADGISLGQPLVLVCEQCGRVAEVAAAAVSNALEQALAASRFAATQTVVEVTGICAMCQTPALSGASL